MSVRVGCVRRREDDRVVVGPGAAAARRGVAQCDRARRRSPRPSSACRRRRTRSTGRPARRTGWPRPRCRRAPWPATDRACGRRAASGPPAARQTRASSRPATESPTRQGRSPATRRRRCWRAACAAWARVPSARAPTASKRRDKRDAERAGQQPTAARATTAARRGAGVARAAPSRPRRGRTRSSSVQPRVADVAQAPLRILLEAAARAADERGGGVPAGSASSRRRSSAPPRACRRRRRRRTRAGPSASRRARRRTPRCRARLSTGLPRACSGRHVGRGAEDHAHLRHRGRRDRRRVHRLRARRRRPASIAFARPKSSTFTVPSARTLMFAGFRSRWMMPCSCAASSASAICFAIGKRLVERDRPRAMRCDEILALDQFHHERGHAARLLRGRRSRRCSDG